MKPTFLSRLDLRRFLRRPAGAASPANAGGTGDLEHEGLLRHVLLGLFIVGLGWNLWFCIRGWEAPLSDFQQFRQTQTAWAARAIAEEGFSLRTHVPVFGPPWEVPMEFPLYQNLVGGLSRHTGMSLVSAGRLVSLLAFYAALPALFLLMRRLIGTGGAWLFLAFVVTAPVYLFYSRAFMIESLALGLAVWGILLLWRAVESPTPVRIFLVSLVLVLAALTKVTTLAGWLLVAGFLIGGWAVAHRREHSPADWLKRLGVGGVLPVVLAIGAALLWIRHGDAIKAENPLSAQLVSAALKKWNYGSWDQLGPVHFERWLKYLGNLVAVKWSLPTLLLLGLLLKGRALLVLAALACFVAPILVFTNLYFAHDYYFYANGVLLLAAVAIGLHAVLREPRFTLPGKAALLALVIYGQVAAAQYYFYRATLRPPPSPLAGELAARVDKVGVVLAYGFSWSPHMSYYAGRKFIMPSGRVPVADAGVARVIGSLPPESLAAMVVAAGFRQHDEFIKAQVQALGFSPEPVFSNQEGDVYARGR